MSKQRKNKGDEREWYPCVVKILQDHDPEYRKGARFRVHDFDDQTWYFLDNERMVYVLTKHAMMPVKPDAMDKLRADKRRTIMA